MLYTQSYSLTWVLVDFLVGYFRFPEELRWGKGERVRPSSRSQIRSVVPFAGHLLCMAWLHGSSPSSLTAGTRVGSGCLGRGFPWLNARTGCGKHSPLSGGHSFRLDPFPLSSFPPDSSEWRPSTSLLSSAFFSNPLMTESTVRLLTHSVSAYSGMTVHWAECGGKVFHLDATLGLTAFCDPTGR